MLVIMKDICYIEHTKKIADILGMQVSKLHLIFGYAYLTVTTLM